MIALAGSKFTVEYKDDDYRVFIKSSYGFKEITKTISQEDKEELISDLIYVLTLILD